VPGNWERRAAKRCRSSEVGKAETPQAARLPEGRRRLGKTPTRTPVFQTSQVSHPGWEAPDAAAIGSFAHSSHFPGFSAPSRDTKFANCRNRSRLSHRSARAPVWRNCPLMPRSLSARRGISNYGRYKRLMHMTAATDDVPPRATGRENRHRWTGCGPRRTTRRPRRATPRRSRPPRAGPCA